jgi:alkanesulfonate monooxygenase SsuD/methylene tetrahydromethanopterin reductase-like flavin-dependent oxidoreductase (luciferase family)
VTPLHLGVILPNYGPALDAERLASVAVAAEGAGFDSGWVTDHMMVPPQHAAIYGTIAEALVSLGFLAGRTRRLALGVSALVVPQRRPLVALKQLTTLDFLSGGRLLVAVSPGWLTGELAALGAPPTGRGRLVDDWLAAAASVFEQMPGRVRRLGGLIPVDGWMAPPLVRRGGPELWAAGVSRATLRRAEATGVWHPVALPPGQLRTRAAELRGRRADSRVILRIGAYVAREPRAGADERGRHAIEGPADWIAARLSEYVDAGCDGFVLNLDHERPGLEERVRQFADEVRPLLPGERRADAGTGNP